jgi:hypothetical protein
LDAVWTYDHFDEDTEPFGENDMGRFTIRGEGYFWNIEYYDSDLV